MNEIVDTDLLNNKCDESAAATPTTTISSTLTLTNTTNQVVTLSNPTCISNDENPLCLQQKFSEIDVGNEATTHLYLKNCQQERERLINDLITVQNSIIDLPEGIIEEEEECEKPKDAKNPLSANKVVTKSEQPEEDEGSEEQNQVEQHSGVSVDTNVAAAGDSVERDNVLVPSNRAIIVLDDCQDGQNQDFHVESQNGNNSDFLLNDLNSDETKIATAQILQNLFHSKIEKCFKESSFTIVERRNTTDAFVKPTIDAETLKRWYLIDHNYAAVSPELATTITKVVPKSPVIKEPCISRAVHIDVYNQNEEDDADVNQEQIIISTVTVNETAKPSLIRLIENNSPLPSDDEKKVESDGEETETAPENEFEGSVTRCICDFVHDDGYMICCDKCSVWQHVDCMGIDKSSIPDDYLCEECNPRYVNREWARSLQARKRVEIFRNLSRQNKDKASQAKRGAQQRKKAISKRTPSANNQDVVKKPTQTRRTYKRRKRNSSSTKENDKSRKDGESGGDEDNGKFNEDNWNNNNNNINNQLLITKTCAQNAKQWIDNYEEAIINHYSAEFRSKILSLKINESFNSISLPTHLPHKCKISLKTPGCIKILTSSTSIANNAPVTELKGKFMLSSEFYNLRSDALSNSNPQYVFHYRLPKDIANICIDTNTYGNDARFIRRSCRPNTELRHCLDRGKFYLFVVAIISIDKNIELTIKHDNNSLDSSECLPCACGNVTTCLLNKPVKKMTEDTSQSTLLTSSATSLPVSIPKTGNNRQQSRHNSSLDSVDSMRSQYDTDEKETSGCNMEMNVGSDEFSESEGSRKSPRRRRRSSKSMSSTKDNDSPKSTGSNEKSGDEKLSREDRKMLAIMKAFEKMEKTQKRKREYRKRPEDQSNTSQLEGNNAYHQMLKYDRNRKMKKVLKNSFLMGRKRFRRKSDDNKSNVNNNGNKFDTNSIKNAAGTLLELANGKLTDSPHETTPKKSTFDTSMDADIRFPNTKKDIMNEWLNKPNDLLSPVLNPDASLFNNYMNGKSLDTLVQAASLCLNSSNLNSSQSLAPLSTSLSLAQPLSPTSKINPLSSSSFSKYSSQSIINNGSAKKRWLRQAIREEEYQSPFNSSETTTPTTPLKKRRVARESISSDHSISPPNTPINSTQLNSDDLDSIFHSFEEDGRDNITSKYFYHLDSSRNKTGGYINKEVDDTEEMAKADSPIKKKLSITEYRQRIKKNDETYEVNETFGLKNAMVGDLSELEEGEIEPEQHLKPVVDKENAVLTVAVIEKQPEVVDDQTEAKPKGDEQDEKIDVDGSNADSRSTSSTSDNDDDDDNDNDNADNNKKTKKISLDGPPNLDNKDLATFNSAPTLVELQAELHTERLKKAFGLLEESISFKLTSSPSEEKCQMAEKLEIVDNKPPEFENVVMCETKLDTDESNRASSPMKDDKDEVKNEFEIKIDNETDFKEDNKEDSVVELAKIAEKSLKMTETGIDVPKDEKSDLGTVNDTEIDEVPNKLLLEPDKREEIVEKPVEAAEEMNPVVMDYAECNGQQEPERQQRMSIKNGQSDDNIINIPKNVYLNHNSDYGISSHGLIDDNFDFVPPFNNPIYPNSFTFPQLSAILS